MSETKRVLLVGIANMDLSLNVYKAPDAGESVTDDGGVAYTPGGSAVGAAVAFARLGADVHLAAKLGADLHGQKLYSYFKEIGISTAEIKVDHTYPTGFSVIIKEGDGRRRTINYPGTNHHLTTENILSAFSCEPEALYLSLDLPQESLMISLRIAQGKGIPIFLNASPMREDISPESLPRLEVFTLNESEAEALVGILPTGMDSALKAALAIRRRVDARYIIIKMGARGAFVYDGKHYDVVPPYKPDCVVDTQGAGDAFDAALTVEYLRSGDMQRAVRFGAAAGAIAVSREGVTSAMPTEEELYEFLRRQLD